VLYCCAWKAVRTSCPRDSMPAARTTPFRSSSVSPTCCARPPTGSRRSRECASPTSSPSTTSSNTKPVCLHCLLSAASEPARPRILPDAFPVMMVPAVSPSTKKFFFPISMKFELSRKFFERITRGNSNVLWYLLPAKRDLQLTVRLRCAKEYSIIDARTNRCKNSLIVYELNHWQ